MTTAPVLPTTPDVLSDAYLVIGISTCFTKEDGEIQEVTLQEPIPSAYLEALLKGVPTSYQRIYGTTVGAVIQAGQPQLLPELSGNVQIGESFVERAIAAARTYQNRPSAQELVPMGASRDDLNYSTEKKRILNADNIVRTEDNVKQHEYTHKVL